MTVVVAAAVVCLIGVVFLSTRWGAEEASAAQMRTSIVDGLGTPRSIRGEFIVDSRPAQPAPKATRGCSNCKPPLPLPSRFILGNDGSYSYLSEAQSDLFPGSVAYDAHSDVLTESGSLAGKSTYVRMTGNDPRVAIYRPDGALATWVLYALDSGDPKISTTKLQGRDAWAATFSFSPGDDYYDTYGARVDVIVDKETGLLVKLTQYENDPNYWTAIETMKNLKVDAPTSAADFALPVPAGAQVIKHDLGFKTVSEQQVKSIVGYKPLLPTDVGGRPLTQLAAAKESNLAFLPELQAPVFANVVTARYGMGLDSITVTTRSGSSPDSAPELTAHTITIGHGLLSGRTAYLSDSPTNPGYLTSHFGELVVEVGAPSSKEVLDAAESLREG